MNALLVADLEHVETIVKEGPGRRLRAAREAKGLDLTGMAKLLHLGRNVIERIEADDYAGLPSSVFVRGYLRNYARMVGEPVEMVLAAYERVRPTDSDNRRVRGITLNKTEIRSNHFLVQLMSVLILLGLAALLAIWWQGYLEQPPATLVNTGPEPLSLTENSPATAFAEASQQPIESQPTPRDAAQANHVPAAAPATHPAQPPANITAKSEPPSAPSAAPPAAGHPPAPIAPAVAAAEEAPVGAAVAAEMVTPKPYTLTLTLKGESWVDVRDAKGKIVFAGVLNKGADKSVEGDGPFQLVLGNAPAVDVSLDGKRVDLAPHTKKKIARLTVDPKKL